VSCPWEERGGGICPPGSVSAKLHGLSYLTATCPRGSLTETGMNQLDNRQDLRCIDLRNDHP